MSDDIETLADLHEFVEVLERDILPQLPAGDDHLNHNVFGAGFGSMPDAVRFLARSWSPPAIWRSPSLGNWSKSKLSVAKS